MVLGTKQACLAIWIMSRQKIFNRFMVISWLCPLGFLDAGKFASQTSRREIRPARPTVQTLAFRPRQSRHGEPVRSISMAAGVLKPQRPQMNFLLSSDALGFHEQQYDSADERERPDGGRDEMAVRGRNVHTKELDGFSWSREADARIGEHHDSQGDQKDCNDGFCVHIGSVFFWPVAIQINRLHPSCCCPAGDDPEQNRYDGEDEENVDQAACSAGNQSQQPQNNQDYCNGV
jgi:hypothetical protein